MISGELEWWKKEIGLNAPASLRPLPLPDVHLWVDASPVGWGAWLQMSHGRYYAFAVWNDTVKEQTSNYKEMLAVVCALRSFYKRMIFVGGTHLKIHSDNSSVVYNIQRKVAGRNLYHPLRALLNLCAQHDTIVSAQHVRGVSNAAADALSRLSRSGDYSLRSGIFDDICKNLNVFPDIDLFATKSNAQLPLFASPIIGDNAPITDALSVNWGDRMLFLHPPIPLIGRCLRKIASENSECVLVLPHWKGQSWNILLNKMSKSMCVIGKSEDVLQPGSLMTKKGDKLPPGCLAAHLLVPPYLL
jgi:ribonuclease HI